MADEDIEVYTGALARRIRERQSKLKELERRPTPIKPSLHLPSSPIRAQVSTGHLVRAQMATTSPLKTQVSGSQLRAQVTAGSPLRTQTSSGSMKKVSSGSATKVPSKSPLPKPATPRQSASKIANAPAITSSKTDIVKPEVSKTHVLKLQVSNEQIEPHALSVLSKKELFEQKMAVPSQQLPAEPEKLSVRSKKSMFENLMRQESDEKRKCITRNEFLARRKAQAKTLSQSRLESLEQTETKVASPAKPTFVQPMESSKSPTKQQSPPQPPPQPQAHPLTMPKHNSRSILTKVSQSLLQTIPDDDYGEETMSLCSQESDHGSLESNPDGHIYPGLPSLGEADSIHSGSPEKRSKHSDEDADTENEAYNADCDENIFTATPVVASPGDCYQQKVSFRGDYGDPVPSSSSGHGSDPLYTDQAAGTTPYRRTISNYRLQQKMIRQQQEIEEAKASSGMKRNMSQLEIWERRKREETQRQIAELKKKELPKLDQTIKQAKAALMICLESTEFKDTDSHADAERHLFVNELKKCAIMSKIDALTAHMSSGFSMSDTDRVTGTIQFEKIELPILRDLAIASKKGLVPKTVENHYYYCVVSYDGTVHSTECVSLNEGYQSGFIQFRVPSTFKFTSLKSDFSLKLELYEITMVRPVKKDSKKVHLPHISKKKTNEVHYVPSPSLPRSVLKGSVEINARNLRRQEFGLKDFVYENALIGKVFLGLSTLANFETQYGNFLHFYDESNGTWRRRWCRIQGPKILAWRHLEDEEAAREPIDSIDLRHCINPTVEPSPYNVCPRRESFILVLAGTQADRVLLRANWLCHKNYSQVVERQILAADMIQERNEWTAKLNQLLEGMRLWDPEVLTPCTAQQMQTYINGS